MMSSVSQLLLKPNTVFTYQDLAAIWQTANKNQLERRVDYLETYKKLIRIRKGIFAIPGREVNKFELANKIRPLSYISFETVLVKEGLIFQIYTSIYSASNLTRQYDIEGQKYIYRQIKEEILLDPLGIEKIDNYNIASIERALLDMLYIDQSFPIDNINMSTFNFDKAFEIAKIYNSKRLLKDLITIKKDFS